MSFRRTAALAAVLALVALAQVRAVGAGASEATLDADQRILHVLDRLGYGPRPGDVERLRRMGLDAYIRQQLDPGRLDDAATDVALQSLRTLGMSTADLLREYPRPEKDLKEKLDRGEMSRRELMERYPPEKRPARVALEMQAAKILRAVRSERQLQEVMVDFWFNHFNVDVRKGEVRWYVTSYERDALRPHALGKFPDLVRATARHPAMLYYLDNWVSVRPDHVVQAGPNRGRRAGLNENYARELMELHTLGVDGGYTQKDVTEVARCFTGWGIDRPQELGTFAFRPRTHDPGEKTVLGHRVRAGGGEWDGEMVIDILTRHPSTARFIATKLVRRFVADDPDPALVARVAATYRATGGDIRAMLRTIVESPEFTSPTAYRAKIKKPSELVVSAARALGASVDAEAALALARASATIGEPLYEAQPPTGHPDTAEAWVNTGALLARMNFALQLTQNRPFADMGGWDTHAGQGNERGQLAQRLGELGTALAAFHRDLGDRMADVVVLTMSEFGRTVHENGNRGTDHGHATAMLVLGGAVRGGKVYGRWPGLAREQLFEGRDLAVTTDFRTLFAEVARRHLRLPDAVELFPGFRTEGSAFLGVM